MKNKDKELFFPYLININSREIHDLKVICAPLRESTENL